MVPKKYQKVIEPTAQQLNLPVDLVDSFVRFYYKELRMTLSGLIAPTINVEGLGQFRVKHWKLDEFEKSLRKGTDMVDVMKFTGFDRKATLETKIEQIKKIRDLVAADEQRRDEHKIKRYGKKTG
jgi:hypothetical protein